LSDALLFLIRSKNTDHFTVWLYFHDEQLSQIHYDKLSKSRQQIKVKTKKQEKKERTNSLSETVAVVDIGTPRSSVHQILNYCLFPICRFTDEVGNMQRLLKPILQLHLRRPPLGSPNLPEAIATLLNAANLHYVALILSHIPFTRSRPLVPQCLALATCVTLLDISFLT
jgi:hypothetical protein